MVPDLLFYPVLNEVEALAGVSDREVIHPTTQHRIDQLYNPIHWLRLVARNTCAVDAKREESASRLMTPPPVVEKCYMRTHDRSNKRSLPGEVQTTPVSCRGVAPGSRPVSGLANLTPLRPARLAQSKRRRELGFRMSSGYQCRPLTRSVSMMVRVCIAHGSVHPPQHIGATHRDERPCQ